MIAVNLLFLHPNFPGQFLHLARHFAKNSNNRVVFLSKQTHGNNLKGVEVAIYKAAREATPGVHPYVRPLEEAVLEGQAIVRTINSLRLKHGFIPDVVIGHSGWGSTLYVKDILPKVPLIGYFEWYYQVFGSDVCYWPDDEVTDDAKLRIRTMNAQNLLTLQSCDLSYCPTKWQQSQFPKEYRDSIRIAHEGIDTDFFCPAPGTQLSLKKTGLELPAETEIVSYVSRGFEPYRGFSQMMDAIRILLARRPNCHVVLAGTDRSCYGPPPKPETTWRQLEEEKGGYDKERVHFTGLLPREDYLNLLQASTVHVYLTRPFVLSWSCLEAMSAGCTLVASATPPVEEAVKDGVNGLLASFRHPENIADRIDEALDDAELRERLGKTARETILERYELRSSLRTQVNMIYSAVK